MSAVLRSITGWKPRKYSMEFEDPLANNKFVVFALVSSLLVPNAAKLFRRALQDERKLTLDEHRRLRMLRKVRRDKDEPNRINKRIDELHTALFDSCYSPNATAENFSASRPPFPPPHWIGEARPFGARRVQLRSNFPSAEDLRYLVADLGYRGDAAIAALSRAHEPWTKVSDRRTSADNTYNGVTHENSSFSPVHPYYPVSPSRRTRIGGGLTKKQVQKGLEKMRTDANTKAALVEIVYRRRSTLRVSNEFNVPVETLYVYASRLRGHIAKADLNDE